jgi:hypothetical protein
MGQEKSIINYVWQSGRRWNKVEHVVRQTWHHWRTARPETEDRHDRGREHGRGRLVS